MKCTDIIKSKSEAIRRTFEELKANPRECDIKILNGIYNYVSGTCLIDSYAEYIPFFGCLPEMIEAVKKREYKLRITNSALAVLGMLYYVSPVDFIPDFIPLIGRIDDVAVAKFIAGCIVKEIQNYLNSVEKKQSEAQNAIDNVIPFESTSGATAYSAT